MNKGVKGIRDNDQRRGVWCIIEHFVCVCTYMYSTKELRSGVGLRSTVLFVWVYQYLIIDTPHHQQEIYVHIPYYVYLPYIFQT